MKRIIKNDKVRVLTGKCAGFEGVVLKVFPAKNTAIVEGVNKVKRFMKNEDPAKRVVEKEMPIHISNLALLDPKNKGKTMKVSFVIKDAIKIRVNRKTKEKI